MFTKWRSQTHIGNWNKNKTTIIIQRGKRLNYAIESLKLPVLTQEIVINAELVNIKNTSTKDKEN